MPDPRDGSWDRQLEQSSAGLTLPDSRLRFEDRDAARIVHGRLVLDRIFCANCGDAAPGGVPPGSPFVFYICDPCFDKANRVAPPGTIRIDG